MVRMTCRSFVVATMSLIGVTLAFAQPYRVTVDWGYRDWSPESFSMRDLRVAVNIGVDLKRPMFQRDMFEYRASQTLKGYGTHTLSFRPLYFAELNLTEFVPWIEAGLRESDKDRHANRDSREKAIDVEAKTLRARLERLYTDHVDGE